MDDAQSVDEKLTAAMKLLDDCIKRMEPAGKKGTSVSPQLKSLLGAYLGQLPGHDDESLKKSPGRALGHKMMEAAIDEMVAQALMRGRRTSNVLNGIFNIFPGLSGR